MIMPENLSISQQKPKFPDYLDFKSLRTIGIDHLQSLSGKLWTDYNLHDPGVTILEVLCYAITDLGYRNNLEIKDLLALNPQDAQSQETNFFTPDAVLTCNPVTELDLRRHLIDIPGVRNAWLEKVEEDPLKPEVQPYDPVIFVNCQDNTLQYTPPVGQLEAEALKLVPRGIYTVCLDLEPELSQDADGKSDRSLEPILERVKKVLCSYRNLCEDFDDLVVLGEEEIALCTDIELTANADPEDVLVEIYVKVQEFLAPRLRFYTLEQLLEKGKSPDEIFAGRPSALPENNSYLPYPDYCSHGFIDPEELEAMTLPTVLYTSDLYQIIMDVEGVAAVKKLSIINYINGIRQSYGDPWCLYLTPKHRPVLGVEQSTVTFFKGELPFKADTEEVKRRYYEQQAAYIKVIRDDHELDLRVPRGNYYDLADYYSIHHDFPLTYGIGNDGLPQTAPPLRQSQARQLKGYLIFFDQLLANYLAQLAHVRDLFSWESEDQRQEHQRTYFTQILSNIPAVTEIIRNYQRCSGSDLPDTVPIDYPTFLDYISEDSVTYQERRNRFLDHLLARFAENFTDYVGLNYRLEGGKRKEIDIINDKAYFLQEYPFLSRDRFRAFNYCDCETVWDTDNVSGWQKRVSRLLGIKDITRRSLSHYEIVEETGDYIIILNDDSGDLSLITQQTYPTLETAQEGLEELLSLALNPNHYQRLSYRYFYHYGWEIKDQQGEVLAVYDRYFPSQAERNASLSPLLRDIQAVLTVPTSEETYFSLESDTDGSFSFRLEIPVTDEPSLTFTGSQRYPNEIETRAAAEEALERIQRASAYQKSRLTSEAVDKPALFTHYGYSLIDTQGELLAENPTRFATEQERDENLNHWLSSLQSNQNQLRIEAATEGAFFAQVVDEQGKIIWSGQNILSDPEDAEAEAEKICILAQDSERYVSINTGIGPCPYSFALKDESDVIVADHPNFNATEEERDRQIQRWQLAFAGSVAFVEISTLNDLESVFSWQMPAALLCAFDNCDTLAQQTFSTGNILSSPPDRTFATATEAEEDFLAQLTLANEDSNVRRDYDNQACTFSFSVEDPATENIVAISPRHYQQRTEMETAIAFIKQVAKGFTFTKTTSGTDQGYYFYLLLEQDDTLIRLQSLNRYPTEQWAWQAAGIFAENLLYFRRYLSPSEEYGFAIVDAQGTLLAATEVELDPREIFRQLNPVEPFLTTELIPEARTDAPSGNRFQLIDRHQRTLLEGTRLFADATAAIDHFYNDVLGFLLEPGIIEPTADATTESFSFRVLSFSPNPTSDPEVLAIHPQSYSSPSQRDQAIERLQLLLKTTRIQPNIQQQLPAYRGQIVGTADEILLQSSLRHTYELADLIVQQTNGDFDRIWYGETQNWEDIATELVNLANSEQLTTQVISAGQDNRERNLFTFKLIVENAATETIGLVGSEQYLNQDQAEIKGNYVLGLVKQLQPSDTSPEIRQFLHQLQRYQQSLEWTIALLDRVREDETLLEPTKEEKAQQAACQQGNVLLELAQNSDNFRLIDDQDGTCTYSWELTNQGKDQILGIPGRSYSSQSQRQAAIAALQTRSNDEGLHLIEHILLRPRQRDPALPRDSLLPISVSEEDCNPDNRPCRTSYDPYSFWMSVILPYWPLRFRDQNFRRFVERTLRLETPAHVALKICWVDACQMADFERAYRTWLEQLALNGCQDGASDLTESLNHLLEILLQLKNVYPEATLHDCEESGPEDNPIILNQTALGTAND